MSVINASSILNAASGCDAVVCTVGVASLVPGLLARLVNQVAFYPPKPAGYHVTPERRVLLVAPSCELVPLPDLSSEGTQVDVVRMWTRRRNTIHGFHFRRSDSRGTILFSHGNSTDVGIMFNHLHDMCRKLRMDVFAYDYSGYGESTGVPSEDDLYADVDAAYNYLIQDRGTPASSIFVCGQSIGSVPSIDLASRRTVGGVILHSALKSGFSIIHDVKTMYWFDVFKNVEKIQRVRAPVLVIHGTHDAEVPFEHGLALYEACPEDMRFDPWWVKNAGHNDIEVLYYSEYFQRLSSFIEACVSHSFGVGRSMSGLDEDATELTFSNQWRPFLGSSFAAEVTESAPRIEGGLAPIAAA
mmetsp:Transcript_63056/g.150254  ORF Transcript_63056/g.150254 Transcript_63056/m.150254 type:complete len:357 (-) Transcript_63056:25-1095(-)